MKKITAALVGVGMQGMNAYGPYVLSHPDELQFTAVAEPDREKREKFGNQHGVNKSMRFESWEELFDKPRLADVVFICTPDKMHFNPAVKAFERGYNIILEKPMAVDPIECIRLGEYSEKYDNIFAICHVLRYTPFFKTIKRILDDGRIGNLVSIQHNENVGHWHQSHSYVRGNWRNSKDSSPMILAKSCHDMDIMLWLAGADCTRLSSFGSLMHFKKKNAPKGAPKMCLDGCPAEKECPYYAPKVYSPGAKGWGLIDAVSIDTGRKNILEELKRGPYGRCVYYCDNDVVDHQVVSIEFSNKVTAAFTMCAFTNETSRTIKLMGTKGEIRGAMEKEEIEILDFLTGQKEVVLIPVDTIDRRGHGGGDFGMIHDIIKLIQKNVLNKIATSADVSVKSHLMAFAAEKARIENRVIKINEYIYELKNQF